MAITEGIHIVQLRLLSRPRGCGGVLAQAHKGRCHQIKTILEPLHSSLHVHKATWTWFRSSWLTRESMSTKRTKKDALLFTLLVIITACRSLMRREPFLGPLGRRGRVRGNYLSLLLLLSTSRGIMSWLIRATITFRFSTLMVTLRGSLGLGEREMVS